MLLQLDPRLNGYEVINYIDHLPYHPSKRFPTRDMSSVDTWIIHHTAHYASLKAHNKYHVESRGWAHIGYTFVISDEKLYQVNPIDVQATHCSGWNHRSLGISINADLSKRALTDKERELLNVVLISLNTMFPGRSVKGHRECAATSCPCTDMNRIREDLMTAELNMQLNDTPIDTTTKIYSAYGRINDLYKLAMNPGKYQLEAQRKFRTIIESMEKAGILK